MLLAKTMGALGHSPIRSAPIEGQPSSAFLFSGAVPSGPGTRVQVSPAPYT